MEIWKCPCTSWDGPYQAETLDRHRFKSRAGKARRRTTTGGPNRITGRVQQAIPSKYDQQNENHNIISSRLLYQHGRYRCQSTHTSTMICERATLNFNRNACLDPRPEENRTKATDGGRSFGSAQRAASNRLFCSLSREKVSIPPSRPWKNSPANISRHFQPPQTNDAVFSRYRRCFPTSAGRG